MRLVANGCRKDGRGELQASVTLLDDDNKTPLFEDSVNLSQHYSRHRFGRTLLKDFPQLEGKDIEAQLLQLLWNAKAQDTQEAGEIKEASSRVSQADKLVKLVEQNKVELFHTPTRVAYARVDVEGHAEIHRCRSQGFRQWLSRQLYLSERKIPNSDALNSAIITIEGKAVYEGRTHELYNRVAIYDGAIFYDLSDPRWRAVKITPEGWEIIDKPPILFCRYQHQKPQVTPQRHGDPWKLLDFVNLADHDQQLLLMIYVDSCFIPDIAHPIIHPHGEQGSAKTTQLRLIGSVVDPSTEELLIAPRDLNELAQKLHHHWVCYFDNLTILTDWVSDMLSRAVTGIGFGKRELYTDEGDVIFQLKRVIGLNGINVVATKPDLLDRCILFELKQMPESCRREEKTLLAEFEEAKPYILGGFLDILSQALRIYPTLEMKALPRMADFAHWGAAISQALGYTAEQFLNVYRDNIRSQNTEVLSSSSIANALLAFMEDRDSYQGTPAELLDELTQQAEQLKIRTNSKGWPSAPQVLTRRLKELKTNLRQGGIDVDTGGGKRIDNKWKRLIGLSKISNAAQPRGIENSVATVASLQTASAPNPVSRNDTSLDIVADGQIPLQKGPGCNDIRQSATISQQIPLQPSEARKAGQQIRPQRCNDSNDKTDTLLAEGNSNNSPTRLPNGSVEV